MKKINVALMLSFKQRADALLTELVSCHQSTYQTLTQCFKLKLNICVPRDFYLIIK